jgi:flagellar biosynthesis protein FlhG
MICDQATDLRRLADSRRPRRAASSARRAGLIVLGSGKGGVGTTTVAVNLAVALARVGRRIALIDADPTGGDVATLCGLEPRHTLTDVLAGRRTICETLQPGPGKIRVLAGRWESADAANVRLPTDPCLADELRDLGDEVDLCLIDVGNRPDRTTRLLCRCADLVLVVTTPQTASIVGAYALIRSLASTGQAPPIRCLVNRATTAWSAEEAQNRLARACRRMLGRKLQSAGHLPDDPRIGRSIDVGTRRPITTPSRQTNRTLKRLAKSLPEWAANGQESGAATLPAFGRPVVCQFRIRAADEENRKKNSTLNHRSPIGSEHYRY